MSAVADAWERAIARTGETATLRRHPSTDATVRIKTVQMPIASLQEPVGDRSVTSARRVLILQKDIDAVSWPLPIKPNEDVLIWNGRTRTIISVDDEVRRFAGETVAIEVEVSGG